LISRTGIRFVVSACKFVAVPPVPRSIETNNFTGHRPEVGFDMKFMRKLFGLA